MACRPSVGPNPAKYSPALGRPQPCQILVPGVLGSDPGNFRPRRATIGACDGLPTHECGPAGGLRWDHPCPILRRRVLVIIRSPRALRAWHRAGGPWYPAERRRGSPARRTHRAEVAQSVEHATENRGVASSILALGTTSRRWSEHRAEVAQLVEHHLAKVRVAGSSPVFRSSILPEGPAAPSSSGRTADFGSVNRGSNPRGAASTAMTRRTPLGATW
jgi:hypothetical protein